MAFIELTEFGLSWLLWLSGAGLMVLGSALLLVLLIKRPDVAAFFRRTLLRAPSLRGRLLVGFCVVGIIPILTLPPLLAVTGTLALQRQYVSQVESAAKSIASQLIAPIDRQVNEIATLAAHINSANDLSEAKLDAWLLRHHDRHPEYVSMWIAKPNGDIAAATAYVGKGRESGAKAWAGPISGVALMDYFQEAIAHDGVYTSSVRKGVSAGHHATMFISSPLGQPGQAPWGHLQAQLDITQLIGERFDVGVYPGTYALLLDARGKVMLRSQDAIFLSFEDIGVHPLVSAMANQAGGGTGQAFKFSGMVDNSGSVDSYLAAAQPLGKGWHAISMVPMSGMAEELLVPLLACLIWTGIAIILARALAGLYSGIVADPLRRLDESLDLFDSEPTISVIPSAPDQAPAEIQAVYDRVRRSMTNSRNSYHTMLKALNEGEDLRNELKKGGQQSQPRQSDIMIVEESAGTTAATAVDGSYTGQIDSVTELPGRELFNDFFGEAWSLGVTGGKALSLIIVGVDTVDTAQLKAAALAFGNVAGRDLDLVARIDAQEFALVLPETELKGGLAVGERTLDTVRSALLNVAGPVPNLNIGIASIVPSAAGNLDSFVKVVQRVLQAAQKKGDGRIAYVEKAGKIKYQEAHDFNLIDWDVDEAS